MNEKYTNADQSIQEVFVSISSVLTRTHTHTHTTYEHTRALSFFVFVEF